MVKMKNKKTGEFGSVKMKWYPNKYGVCSIIHKKESKTITLKFDNKDYAIAFALSVFDIIRGNKK